MATIDDGDSTDDRSSRLEARQLRTEKADQDKRMQEMMSLLTLQVTSQDQQRQYDRERDERNYKDQQEKEERIRLDAQRNHEMLLLSMQQHQDSLKADRQAVAERRIRMGRDIPILPKLEDPRDIQLFMRQFQADMETFKVPQDQWTTMLRPLLDVKSMEFSRKLSIETQQNFPQMCKELTRLH